ncbi:sulfurtransferase complex subunit TusC [Agarivorans sp. JK6]|uniref:sulfurtransferase complex subunit TusC n=1 Tax=Agarivorans sp. JK6 TaxID=2997426 RepID=UPI003873BE6B
MSKSLVFVFSRAPHGNSLAREALDAALAASAVSEDIVAYFEGDGVYQLLRGQNPTNIKQRDVLPTYGLLDLYDVEEIYVDQQSLKECGLSLEQLAISVRVKQAKQFYSECCHAHAILRF